VATLAGKSAQRYMKSNTPYILPYAHTTLQNFVRQKFWGARTKWYIFNFN